MKKQFSIKQEALAVDLPQLVRDFCEEQKWAVQAWKDQPHIKPLFDFVNAKHDSPDTSGCPPTPCSTYEIPMHARDL